MWVAGFHSSLWTTLVVVIFFSGSANGGFERRYAGARSLGTAGALCSFGEDAWSFYFNPARAARGAEVNVFYSPRMLGLEEITLTGIACRGSLLGVDAGGAVQTFGFDLYRETVGSISLSAPLYHFLFAGVNLNANHVRIQDYGSDFAVSLDFGTRMFFSDNFSTAFSVTNLNSAAMTMSRDRLPQVFTFGLAYQSAVLNLGTEYFKELGFPSGLRIAAEYLPAKFLVLRLGSASGTATFNAGVSVKYGGFQIDYGVALHQVLGTTHSFGLSFGFDEIFGSEFEKIVANRNVIRGR